MRPTYRAQVEQYTYAKQPRREREAGASPGSQHHRRNGTRKCRQKQSRCVLAAVSSWYRRIVNGLTDANETMRTSAGPRGTIKMLVDGAGNLKMTKVSSGCSETRNGYVLKLWKPA